MPRTVLPPPMGKPLLPDMPNWAWHEYGMRVGFWRFLEVLGARNLKATFAVNGAACTTVSRRRARPRSTRAGNSWATASFSGRCTCRRPGSAIRDTIQAIKDHRQAAPRLGKPRVDRDRRNAGSARRSRYRVRRGLGAGRAAGDAQDPHRQHGLGPLHGRDQRRRHQRRPAAAVRRNPASRARPVRSALSRGRRRRG